MSLSSAPLQPALEPDIMSDHHIDPESGLESDRVDRIVRLLEAAHDSEQFSGAAWAIVRGGDLAASGTVGTQGGDLDRPVTSGSLFDMASLTKPLATATSALYLYDRGEFLMGDEVRRFFPTADARWEGVTIRHLMTHTSGLPPYAPLYETCRDGHSIRDAILELGPESPPGDKYSYSCLSYILLQHVIQEITGESLATFAARVVFGPLGLAHTGYRPIGEITGATENCLVVGGHCPHRDQLVTGEVHDPLAWAAGGVSGNAGLFSCLDDVCRLAVVLLDRGAAHGYCLFGPATADRMLTNQLDPRVGGHTFGFFAYPNGMLPRGELLPETSVGHTGFTGTSLVLVPDMNLAAVLLCNSLYHGRDKLSFFRTRRLFHTLVGAAVTGPASP